MVNLKGEEAKFYEMLKTELKTDRVAELLWYILNCRYIGDEVYRFTSKTTGEHYDISVLDGACPCVRYLNHHSCKHSDALQILTSVLRRLR